MTAPRHEPVMLREAVEALVVGGDLRLAHFEGQVVEALPDALELRANLVIHGEEERAAPGGPGSTLSVQYTCGSAGGRPEAAGELPGRLLQSNLGLP